MDTETIVMTAATAVWIAGAAVTYGIISHLDRNSADVEMSLMVSSFWPIMLLAIVLIVPLVLIGFYIIVPLARPFVIVGGLIGRAIEPLMNWMENR